MTGKSILAGGNTENTTTTHIPLLGPINSDLIVGDFFNLPSWPI
jgi:hypothetical protein